MHASLHREPVSRRLPWWALVIGLTIAYSPMFLNRIARSLGMTWSWLEGPPSVLVWNWIVVFCLFLFIFLYERRTLSSIGLVKPGGKDIQWAFIFWAGSLAVSWLAHALLPPPPSSGLDVILALSIPVLIMIIFTTSITEEILYRGFAIERLRELTGSTAVAVVISFALFVLPHILFFGAHWLLYHGLSAVLIYVLYVWRRNLFACMLMHLLGNLMILIPALGYG